MKTFGRGLIWTAALALTYVTACSLGDGVTPECFVDEPPDSPDACHQVSACDDGTGNVIPEQGCCEVSARRQYGICAQTNETEGAVAACNSDPNGDCCGVLQAEFDACMANPTGGGQGG